MPTLTELLEAGAHFGHKKERSYPKAKKFTYTIRDNVYVIDLEQTVKRLDEAINYLKAQIENGKIILFVGTKRQAKIYVKKLAQNLNMPYVVERWLGGMLTNFETVYKSLKKLEKLEELMKSEDFNKYTKKERRVIEEKQIKLSAIFEGLRNFNKLPDGLFVVDSANEKVAVLEARKINIPIVGICDTNANPDLINYPIPANDDSEKTIKLISEKIEEGVKGIKIKKPEIVAEEPAKVEIKKDEKADIVSKSKPVFKEKKTAKAKTKISKEKK